MDVDVIGWALAGLVGIWAAGMTVVYLVSRKKIGSLIRSLGSVDIGENRSLCP
jgi:hypothetical protein